ncbi:hypothetical protein FSP39_017060 [Pinctada imbricata]|uniref:Delta-like protein n=1 Tax=Pinctada imbricata TaxID=66713 RepID=A0AA88YEX4_PINIB|nr:hypothetical protein FSP39_017060 [Pinctada imbricata]
MLILKMLQIVWSTGKIEVKFSRYINHGGTGVNGHCCDGRGIFCFSHCDHRFIICLDRTTGGKSLRRCYYGRKSSRDIPNRNTINFGRSIGGVPNPMVYSFKSWPGTAALKVDVYDVDDNEDDKVDFLYGKFSATAQRAKAGSKEKTHRLSTPRTLLDYKIRVYCDANYFGPKCEVYCVPQDDSSGHYTCDSATGKKICNEGWFGEKCDENRINECENIPPPCNEDQICNDTKSGYICTCPEGFWGEFCNQTNSTLCDNSLCLNNGTCILHSDGISCNCTESWTGEFCEIPMSEVDPCFINLCQNNANCIKIQNGYECECPETTQGFHCENTSVCHSDDDNPCEHGSECVRLNGSNGWYECLCEAGYSGVHCEHSLSTTTVQPVKLQIPDNTTVSSVEATTMIDNVTDHVTESEKRTTTTPIIDKTMAKIYLLAKVDKGNQDIEKSFARMIKDLLKLEKEPMIKLHTEIFKGDKGDIITEVEVTAMKEGIPIDLSHLQKLFLDPWNSNIQKYLPVPIYSDVPHTHPRLNTKQKALQQLHETSWIHKHWYVVLLGVLALVVGIIVLTGIIIFCRRKSQKVEEKPPTNIPTSSTGVKEVSPQSFENSLYFEMDHGRQNSSSRNTYSRNLT